MRRATPFAVAAVSLVALVPSAQAAPQRVVAAAAEECRAERDANPVAFQAEYANAKGRHAMKRCVRAQVRDAREACRAERDADPSAFKLEYGKGRGGNAMARCLVETISEDDGPVIPTDPPVEEPT